MAIDEQRLREFIRESNHIEGIDREPTELEVITARAVLNLDSLCVPNIELAVRAFQSDARLRDKVGMDVRIGNHIAPPGGPFVKTSLAGIISCANALETPYSVHCEYQTLHPFTDGNGRSGRLLWLWMMVQRDKVMPPLGFLHSWYYQTLTPLSSSTHSS